MSRKKIIFTVLLLLIAGLLVACGQAVSDEAVATVEESEDDEVVVGHTWPDLQNPYYVSVLEGVEPRMEELGYTYIATDSTQDPAKQVTDVENLVERGVDVIFIDAVDPVAVVPAVEKANEAEIPVVALIREPDGGRWETLVYLDSIEHGRTACEYIVEQLNGEGTVADLQGILATQPGRERSRGCELALMEAPDVELVAQVQANFNRVDALNAMEDILQVHPDVDAVFGGNDEEALGAVEAFKAAGIDPKDRIIVGVDGTAVALEAICRGEMKATVATIARQEAEIIAELAQRITSGESVPSRIEFPGILVTRDNVEEIIERSGFDIDCDALSSE